MESCHKTEQDKEGLLKALTTNIITTDHAPHTLEEKTLFSIYVRRPNGSALSQLHVRVL
jgi:dihydroorotase-like cyclic amidohydrolase